MVGVTSPISKPRDVRISPSGDGLILPICNFVNSRSPKFEGIAALKMALIKRYQAIVPSLSKQGIKNFELICGLLKIGFWNATSKWRPQIFFFRPARTNTYVRTYLLTCFFQSEHQTMTRHRSLQYRVSEQQNPRGIRGGLLFFTGPN